MWIKLTPNVTSIAATAKGAEAGGADAIVAINTMLGMAIDIRTRRPLLHNNTGGLSGPCVKPVALRMVHAIYDAVKIPVVTHIDDKIREMAGGSGSNRGTGGMATKITAAAAATGAGINCCVMSGNDPANIYKLIEGEQMGTMFVAAEGRI